MLSPCHQIMCKIISFGQRKLNSLELSGVSFIVLLFQEAQNRVAAFALCHLFPDIPVQFLITEPYATLVSKWEEGKYILWFLKCIY